MKYNTYLFDFDGTLVDSMPAYTSVMLKILDEYSVSYQSDIVKIITPLGYEGTAKYFVELGINEPWQVLVEKMRSYAYDEYKNRIPAKNNVISVLKALKDSGASLNVLTASPHVALDVCLERLGIFDIFDNVWSCEDFGTTKADLKIYEMAADKMGVGVADVLFLDDNFNADKSAKEAGMKVCGVFDESSKEYVGEMKALCDHYIFDFSELPEI